MVTQTHSFCTRAGEALKAGGIKSSGPVPLSFLVLIPPPGKIILEEAVDSPTEIPVAGFDELKATNEIKTAIPLLESLDISH